MGYGASAFGPVVWRAPAVGGGDPFASGSCRDAQPLLDQSSSSIVFCVSENVCFKLADSRAEAHLTSCCYSFELAVCQSWSAEIGYLCRYTYLNKQGRTVMHMRTTNMIDALSQPFVVRYRVPPLAWAREPALWGGSLAAILATLVSSTPS